MGACVSYETPRAPVPLPTLPFPLLFLRELVEHEHTLPHHQAVHLASTRSHDVRLSLVLLQTQPLTNS